jgi:uncharacterized protein (DUF4415 family)
MPISKTNWDRLRTMSDDEIDTSDIPPLDESFFDNAELRVPEGTVPVLLNIDEEIVEWYQQQGGSFQGLLNTALRTYIESHR